MKKLEIVGYQRANLGRTESQAIRAEGSAVGGQHRHEVGQTEAGDRAAVAEPEREQAGEEVPRDRPQHDQPDHPADQPAPLGIRPLAQVGQRPEVLDVPKQEGPVGGQGQAARPTGWKIAGSTAFGITTGDMKLRPISRCAARLYCD